MPRNNLVDDRRLLIQVAQDVSSIKTNLEYLKPLPDKVEALEKRADATDAWKASLKYKIMAWAGLGGLGGAGGGLAAFKQMIGQLF